MFASPATESPETTPMASGRKIGSSTPTAAKATNRPLPVMELTKSGPSPASGADAFTPIASDSAADIEALPGQGNEDVLQAGATHREAEDGHVGVHEVRHDLGDLDLAQGRADPVVGGGDVGQPQLGQHAGGVLRPVGVDPDGLGRA